MMDDYDVTGTPITICWHCDRPLDAASSFDDGGPPARGSVSLCLYCGAVALFGDDLALVAPTEEQLDELFQSGEFKQQWAKFMWARQYVMLRDSLLRDRSDPDR